MHWSIHAALYFDNEVEILFFKNLNFLLNFFLYFQIILMC